MGCRVVCLVERKERERVVCVCLTHYCQKPKHKSQPLSPFKKHTAEIFAALKADLVPLLQRIMASPRFQNDPVPEPLQPGPKWDKDAQVALSKEISGCVVLSLCVIVCVFVFVCASRDVCAHGHTIS